jgi:hypothetical protein
MCEASVRKKNSAESAEKLVLCGSGRPRSNQRPLLWTWAKLEDVELAAGPVQMETIVEARIARLESDVAHMRTDIADIKVDLRAVRDKLGTMARGFGWI